MKRVYFCVIFFLQIFLSHHAIAHEAMQLRYCHQCDWDIAPVIVDNGKVCLTEQSIRFALVDKEGVRSFSGELEFDSMQVNEDRLLHLRGA